MRTLSLLLFFTFVSLEVSEARTLKANPTTPSGLEHSPLATLQAVVGGTALLPCNVTPPTPDDAPILVLFFYGKKGTPIYSVDARGSAVYQGHHWSDADQLGDRARMLVGEGEEQGLALTRLVGEDGGQYRCRVDFRSSPTRNMRVHLYIIVPPRHILITSSWDEGRVVEGVIGPYPEGADLTLTCQVTGGQPRPKVVWWQSDLLLDAETEEKTEQVTRNSLRLPRLTRDDLLKKVTCVASNNNITSHLVKDIYIDIAFPPTSVRIWVKTRGEDAAVISNFNSRRGTIASFQLASPSSSSSSFGVTEDVVTVRAGQEAHLVCESTGSRPQARLDWRKNGEVVPPELISTNFSPTTAPSSSPEARGLLSASSSVSLSALRFKPHLKDHKAVVSCRASSSALPKETLEDQVTLNVLFPPQISLSFESSPPSEDLREGDEVILSCSVHGNPSPGRVQWAREGVPILGNSTTTALSVIGSRLVLHRSSRPLTGRYTCAAANSEGANTSRPLHLRVKYAPVCFGQQQRQYGTGRQEEVTVTCQVDSYPEPTGFHWAFNRSSEVVDIPQNTYSVTGSSSTLVYRPQTEMDFGSLLCWAENPIGVMVEPCVLQVVPAAKPEPVRNCDVINNSTMPASVAIVSCIPGWDGGLKQSFTLEVRESKNKHSRILASVQHSLVPYFNLKGLKHREHYLFIITAVNVRGTSPPVTVSYITPVSEVATLASNAHTGDNTTWISWTSFVAVIFGVMLTVLSCLCAVIGLMKFKSSSGPSASSSGVAIPGGRAGTRNLRDAKIVYAPTSGKGCEKDEELEGGGLGSPTIISCSKYLNNSTDNLKASALYLRSLSPNYNISEGKLAENFSQKDSDFRNSCTENKLRTLVNDMNFHRSVNDVNFTSLTTGDVNFHGSVNAGNCTGLINDVNFSGPSVVNEVNFRGSVSNVNFRSSGSDVRLGEHVCSGHGPHCSYEERYLRNTEHPYHMNTVSVITDRS